MEAQLEQLRDQQKESWNKFSPGWKKWDELVMRFLKPYGDEIIKLLKPSGNDYVLDIASGTGEPGLTIAGMLTGGKVVATDVSSGMLEVAKENADKRGLNNFETKVCDVTELPFDDATFDAISCRMGFMFFPDMQMAANEMYRVLKPGGRMATSVWNGPEKNFWVTGIMGTIKKQMDLPNPPPGSPGMFRCAEAGLMENIFKKAGFNHISEKEVTGDLEADNVNHLWNFMTDVGAPIVAALSHATDEQYKNIKEEVFKNFTDKYGNGELKVGTSAQVLYAEK